VRIAELLGLSSRAEHYATGCETCAALRDTISRQADMIETLNRFLEEEKEERRALLLRFNVLRVTESAPTNGSDTKQVRTSRVPWSHQQARLERQSAKEADDIWRERARKAAEADGSKTGTAGND
jgi:hypothetical protein